MLKNWVWCDLEMTGLDPELHKVIEIATIITNTQLEVIAQGPALVIHVEAQHLHNLDPWITSHHGATGLLDAVTKSVIGIDDAMHQTLEFIKSHCKINEAPLCGNSIGTDRAFLRRHMPALESYLHYRNIDVSSVKLLLQAWRPDLAPFKKKVQHRALDDILESIAELKYYQTHLMAQKTM